MPFPYVDAEEFKEEYPPDYDDLGFDSEMDYEFYLTRVLERQSETIEGPEWANDDWRGDGVTVPGPVEEAVTRLARLRIDNRISDTLSSEQSPSGRQESYRDPAEVEQAIQESLHRAGYQPDGVGFQFESL